MLHGVCILVSMVTGGGHPDTILLLLEKGADPNHRGQFQRTPLYRAAFAGHLEACQVRTFYSNVALAKIITFYSNVSLSKIITFYSNVALSKIVTFYSNVALSKIITFYRGTSM